MFHLEILRDVTFVILALAKSKEFFFLPSVLLKIIINNKKYKKGGRRANFEGFLLLFLSETKGKKKKKNSLLFTKCTIVPLFGSEALFNPPQGQKKIIYTFFFYK